jgi:cyclopropane fatty-acyl-phospholipid synthase-like methyltransferase
LRRDSAAALRAPERAQWTLELLDVQPSDHILEIGCGPGHAVALVCARLRSGTITAIDRSPLAVARARDRNEACVAAGRAVIEQRILTDARLGRRFDKIFAINVNAFWTTPAPNFAALRNLLIPKGLAYLVYEPPSAVRLRELRNRLPARIAEHGFEVVDVQTRAFRARHGLGLACALTR